MVKSGNSERTLLIHSSEDNNLILDQKTNDTIFNGKVSKFRGLYFFNQENPDQTFTIYSVRIEDNLIYGLSNAEEQSSRLAQILQEGKFTGLISKCKNKDSVCLKPKKRDLRKAFASILSGLSPDTIISASQLSADSSNPEPIDPQEHEYILNIYPNPVKDYLNIALIQKHNEIKYQVMNFQGTVVREGQESGSKIRIDMQSVNPGNYLVKVWNPNQTGADIVRVIKEKDEPAVT